MKIDRLLKIVIYLLNHENVSARDLAERLHVSVRTIQRDMVSIAEAGIPVYSNQERVEDTPFCRRIRLETAISTRKNSS